MNSTVQRTGPVVFRECESCEGVGTPGCPTCKGTGRIPVDVHPFGTLEALYEHVGALQNALGIEPHDWGVDGPKLSSDPVGYHLTAVDMYAKSLLQQLIVLLPEEWARTEGRDR